MWKYFVVYYWTAAYCFILYKMQRLSSFDKRRINRKAKKLIAWGEATDRSASYTDQSVIDGEEKYDGFYAVCTNLEDEAETIIKANKRRWETEECFRIMKTDFEARLVYVKRKDRILAHFITCFISPAVYCYLGNRWLLYTGVCFFFLGSLYLGKVSSIVSPSPGEE